MRWNPRRSGRQALFRTKSGKFNGVLWWHPHLWSLGIQCNGILLHIMWCIDYSGCIALWNKFVCNFTTFERFGHYSGGIGTFLTSSLPWPPTLTPSTQHTHIHTSLYTYHSSQPLPASSDQYSDSGEEEEEDSDHSSEKEEQEDSTDYCKGSLIPSPALILCFTVLWSLIHNFT